MNRMKALILLAVAGVQLQAKYPQPAGPAVVEAVNTLPTDTDALLSLELPPVAGAEGPEAAAPLAALKAAPKSGSVTVQPAPSAPKRSTSLLPSRLSLQARRGAALAASKTALVAPPTTTIPAPVVKKPVTPGAQAKAPASQVIQQFIEQKMTAEMNTLEARKQEEAQLEMRLAELLSQQYQHDAVSGTLSAWAQARAAREEAEKTVTFLKEFPVDVANPVTMLTMSIEHAKETAGLLERASYDAVACGAQQYRKGMFAGLFGKQEGQEDAIRYVKYALGSYHAAQVQWYRKVLKRMNDLWLLSGGQFIAQKNRELQSLDDEYVPDDFVDGRSEKEVGWHTTKPLPAGNYDELEISVESLEKQKADVRTFAGTIGIHELIRQRKHDWEAAQKLTKQARGAEKAGAERFEEFTRQAYELDAGRLEVQNRIKWIMSDIAKARAQIESIDDDDPHGTYGSDASHGGAALKVLDSELARFNSSSLAMGDFMLGRFVNGLKKHAKRIEGLAPINDELNNHLTWLRKNSSPGIGTAIAGIEWALRAQTANQLL